MDMQTRIGDFVSSALLLGSVLLLFVWIYRDHRYGTDDGEWFVHGLFA